MQRNEFDRNFIVSNDQFQCMRSLHHILMEDREFSIFPSIPIKLITLHILYMLKINNSNIPLMQVLILRYHGVDMMSLVLPWTLRFSNDFLKRKQQTFNAKMEAGCSRRSLAIHRPMWHTDKLYKYQTYGPGKKMRICPSSVRLSGIV